MNIAKEVTLIANNPEVFEVAAQAKDDFASRTRLISIEGDAVRAVSAAYKTASGLYSEAEGQITTCIYNMRKLDIALLIARNDDSDDAFDRAAFEVARDAFVSGKLDSKAECLAQATGRPVEACYNLIYRKLAEMTAQMDARSNLLKAQGEIPESPEAIRDAILASGGKYLLSLPTGYGKTSKIIEPVLQHYLEAGKKVLVISHRRSINKNIANIPGIVSYDECNSPEVIERAQGLKIVVNSLAANKFKAFIESVDLVVIDEASQVISHVLGGEVKERQAVWKALNFVVKRAANVILSDADIDTRCADLIGEARLYSEKQDHSGIEVHLGEINHVRALAIKSAAEGHRVLISCDVVKEATALAKTIEKAGGPTPLVITAENAKWKDQAAFIADPNSTDHQVVIYSPVITSALSITSGHFEHRYGLFQGQVIPRDAVQMLRRDRGAELFTVGIKGAMYSKAEAVEISFKKQRVQIDEALSSLPIDDELKAKVRSAVYSQSNLVGFKALEYKHCADEAWLKDNIAHTLPATLLAQGFQVTVLDHNDELSKSGYSANNQGRKAAKDEVVQKLLGSNAASQNLVAKVRDSGSADAHEHFQVIRARAEAVMGVEELTEDDAKVWGLGEGESKIKSYRAVFSGVLYENAEQADAAELLRQAASRMSGSAWLGEDSIGLYDSLNRMRSDVFILGIKMGNPRSEQAKKAEVTKIFAQLGLKVKRRESTGHRFYAITPASIAQMNRYV